MRLHNQTNKTNSKLWQRFSICLLINLTIIVTAFGQTTDQTKPELVVQTGHIESISSVAFSPDGKTLATGSFDKTIKLWDMVSEKELRALQGHSSSVESIAFSPDGKTLASGSWGEPVILWDVASGIQLKALRGQSENVNLVMFSPDGKTLASVGYSTIKLWDVENWQELRTLQGHISIVESIAFSTDGNTLASVSQDKTIKLWNMVSGKELTTLRGNTSWVNSVAFSPDGKTLALGSADIKLWDVVGGKELRTLQGHTSRVDLVAFSADGKTLASGSWDNTIKLWDTGNGKLLKSFQKYEPKTEDEVSAIVPDFYEKYGYEAKTTDGKFQIKIDNNGKLNLIEVNTGKLLASLVAIDKNEWIVTTPEGLFDGTSNAWKNLIWRFDNNTFDYAPVEAFFKEFYRPGLLQDIFNGVPIEPPTTDLSKIDIRQPSVKISAVDGKAVDSSALLPEKVSAGKKNIKVKVEITDNVHAPRSGISKDSSSDAQDVRLFRNGSMVKFWGKVDEKTKRSVSIFDFTEKDGCQQIPASKDSPRKAVCETEIAITAGENELTVYGFNHQDVKSSDNTALVVGAESLKREGTLYVLAVGVNKYKNTDYNLNFAVKDVEEIGTALQEQQTKLGNLKQYAKTEVITLTDVLATKENILTALKKFADGDKTAVSENISNELKTQLNKIKQTQPEDALVIYFAGHGVSRGQRFYLLPHNFTGDAKLLESESVSDLELNEYLEKVDAGKILMTIDACQSGQALGGKNDGKAPMNSKGFAQLAYDKGMFILTAAQSQQAALEAVNLNGKIIENGLLTYTLLEALKDKETDQDGNAQIFEKEWFDYATSKVPQMQLEAMKNRSVEVSKGEKDKDGKRKVEIFYVEGDDEKNADDRRVQTPRIFYKRETDANPLIIAKP